MDSIALAAETALAGAMATDAWQEIRTTSASLRHRVRPEQAEVTDAEFAEVRTQLPAVRRAADADAEQVLAAGRQTRPQSLRCAKTAAAGELRQLLDTRLTPALTADEQTRNGAPMMSEEASGRGRMYQAGRDQHISER